jgi:hypothetical protein
LLFQSKAGLYAKPFREASDQKWSANQTGLFCYQKIAENNMFSLVFGLLKMLVTF